MIDDDRESPPLGLQPFPDPIDRVQVYPRNIADNNVREIEFGQGYLFSGKPFVTGVPANVDDDIRLEDIPQILIKRQVLMMRRHDVGTVQAIRIGLPSALRLGPDEDIP